MSDDKLDLVLNELKNVNARLELLKDVNTKLELLEDINARLELLELKQDLTHKKLDNLTLDVKVSERSIKKDIKLLQDAQDTLVEVLEQSGILPKIK